MTKSIKLMGCIALFVVVALSSCSSKKYDSWSECISAESQKSDNGAVTRVYCDSNYDMTDREREVRHNVYCSDILNKAEPECNPTVPQSGASTSAVTGSAGEATLVDTGSPKPPTLAEFSGKYRSDSVRGFTFYDHPKIRAALNAAVPNQAIKDAITSRNVTGGSVEADQWSLTLSGCEPHNCGAHNWRFVYIIGEDAAQVCYYNLDAPPSLTKWYNTYEETAVNGGCLS